MTSLIDWRTLEAKIDNIQETWEYETRSMALAHVLLETLFGISSEEITESITDGPNDRGIDAIYINYEKVTVHIFQFKYTTKFDHSKNNYPSSEIDKLLSFVADLLSKEVLMQNNCNSLLWAKVQDIWDILETEIPHFEIHLCGNMSELVSTQFDRINNSLLPYRNFQVKQYSLQTIVSLILEKKRKSINGEVHFIDKQFFERGEGNIRGLIAALPATELINLIINPENPNEVLTEVFNDNIRIYLGSKKNAINQKILKSALNQSSEFWYLNNGITITCNSFNYPAGTRSPLVKLEDFQIVNGGQTSNALFEAYKNDKDKLNDVLVLVRIYETKNREISLQIAESTNSQTPIKSRDLHSNDEIQLKLADEFESMGFYYERKTNQYKEKEKRNRIDALTAGQTYLAYYLDFPEVAKKDRGRVFGDLYDLIFNSEICAKKLLVPLEIFAPIDNQKRIILNALRRGEAIDSRSFVLLDGNYHVLSAIYHLCQRRNVDESSPEEGIKFIDDAINIVNDVMTEQKHRIENNGGIFRIANFFKDSDTKTLIHHEIIMNHS